VGLLATNYPADFLVRGAKPSDWGDLVRINLDDLIEAFGWGEHSTRAHVAQRVFAGPATTFARRMAEFDALVGRAGLVEAARATVGHFVEAVRVHNPERIPDGAFLALSNHPGLCDALSLFSALGRSDLQIIAARRPFLDALTHTAQHLAYLVDEPAARVALLRQVAAHLRGGGAALTFPAGRIEPDPACQRGAMAGLAGWSASAGALARLAPDAAILPVLVRGVVWRPAAWAGEVGWHLTARDREKRSAALQLLAHTLCKVRSGTVRVQIGRPVWPGRDLRAVHAQVLAEVAQLIEQPPRDVGIKVPLARG